MTAIEPTALEVVKVRQVRARAAQVYRRHPDPGARHLVLTWLPLHLIFSPRRLLRGAGPLILQVSAAFLAEQDAMILEMSRERKEDEEGRHAREQPGQEGAPPGPHAEDPG